MIIQFRHKMTLCTLTKSKISFKFQNRPNTPPSKGAVMAHNFEIFYFSKLFKIERKKIEIENFLSRNWNWMFFLKPKKIVKISILIRSACKNWNFLFFIYFFTDQKKKKTIINPNYWVNPKEAFVLRNHAPNVFFSYFIT